MHEPSSPDYLNPDLPGGLSRLEMPVVVATDEALRGYGRLVERIEDVAVEIVRWPAQGWRPIDTGTGDEAGTREGTFDAQWRGDVLYGHNDAVSGHYILGYAADPAAADEPHDRPPERLLLWHANYHPDGGQLFFPLDGEPYLVPLALPGDDRRPEDFVCFHVDGRHGLYIHPNIWHEGVFPLRGRQRFFDRQGAVHARVSMDFAREFDCLLEARIPVI